MSAAILLMIRRNAKRLRCVSLFGEASVFYCFFFKWLIIWSYEPPIKGERSGGFHYKCFLQRTMI